MINKDLLYSTGNPAQCDMEACMGGKLRRGGIRVCVAESLCCPPETITTLLTGYTPIQNKKFKKINIHVRCMPFPVYLLIHLTFTNTQHSDQQI